MEAELVQLLSDSDSSLEIMNNNDDDIHHFPNFRGDDDDIRHVTRPQQQQQPHTPQNPPSFHRGNFIARQHSMLPQVGSVSSGPTATRKPFKTPFAKGNSNSMDDLLQQLLARKQIAPSHPSTSQKAHQQLPPGIEPLVLWQPDESMDKSFMTPIVVDPVLVRFLRPHQREGVQFMFGCVSGLLGAANIHGCILADDMGLGKTLQSITLLHTLLTQGFDGKPMVWKAIIVTPTSLVSNWKAEIKKWVGERVRLIALCESGREDVISEIDKFTNSHSRIQVLIVSYETFRTHSQKLTQNGSCELLICDEAHRLKNDQTMTNRALASLSCKRRILLSGTPMQNDLEEFYAMVNFTNPGILGDTAHFRRYYQAAVLFGREPTATEQERMLGVKRSEELSAIVNQFILRRTNALLSNHLPPKIVEVVCCKLTHFQSELYNHFIQSKNVKRALTREAKHSEVLAYITALKKLCNHPKLIYDSMKGANSGISGFEDCLRLVPPEILSGRSFAPNGGDSFWAGLSGKMNVLSRLLGQLRQNTDDRIVLVSNYTQTLDLFAQLCDDKRYPYLRLDGTISISKRQQLVDRFNDLSKDEFAFLLSSKAGGCGLNLIGGNRLVLFDPDWNPANDKQAAARVWRDGQKKRVYIYRFLSTGTIEEKIYQRQMSKEGLQKVIQQDQSDSDMGSCFSMEELRDLFSYHVNIRSDIHEKMNCLRCKQSNCVKSDWHEDIAEVFSAESVSESYRSHQPAADIGGFAEMCGLHKLKSSQRQVGTPLEEDLLNWAHHLSPSSVPDLILQASAGDEVSFVFTNQIGGELIPVEPVCPTKQTLAERKQKSMVSSVQKTHSRNLAKKSTVAATKPIQVAPLKLIRPSLGDVTNLPCSPKISLNGQPPAKRFCQTREDNYIMCP